MEMNKKKSSLRFETMKHNPKEKGKERCLDLGNGSQVTYIPRFLPLEESWKWLDYLDNQIPWTRPSIRVFGQSCIQPRDTCYIASEGLPELKYSGYQPHAYSWDEFPLLKVILAAVHEALPGSSFNSLLLNRYKSGSDYVAWHSDAEKFYGRTPDIASVSFGCEREFLLRKKPSRLPQEKSTSKRLKGTSSDQHSFMLKHGSLLVMKGYTQRDWVHSVPKRAKADAIRINLTFRCIQI
ncbi:DNA oxidative demethylase ALKBH2 [Magnolia sinica]|uniref:DNA oxidative demethylase ALKBH2 n=1 Tax=Magnolia sinica TaxID=86752 RepID=UPI00265813A3|nr:DNA oxidative demethylase ALKBH2 [Magnolia sinica]